MLFTIKTDSHYTIGDSHKYCEDFALHGNEELFDGELAYAIVCDGCSSSMTRGGIRLAENVDIGARLMALAARQTLFHFAGEWLDQYDEVFYVKNFEVNQKRFSDIVLAKINSFKNACSLHPSVFDTTLLVAFYIKRKEKSFGGVFVFGDGAVLVENNKLLTFYNINFPTGAPYYLSYQLDYERNKLYNQQFGGIKFFDSFSLNKETELTVEPTGVDKYDFSSQIFIPLDTDSLKVTLFSDGVCSFSCNKEENSLERINCDPFEIARELSNYKINNGEFVKKSLNLWTRKAKKSNHSHYDDLAIASMFIGERE